MFKVYNKSALTRNERFKNAVVVGVLATIGLTIAYAIVSRVLMLELQILYIGIGYLIGLSIQKAGKGVQPRFSILAACLALLCFIIGDIIAIFGPEIIMSPNSWLVVLRIYFSMFTELDSSIVFSLVFRIIGVYCAYNYARIV